MGCSPANQGYNSLLGGRSGFSLAEGVSLDGDGAGTTCSVQGRKEGRKEGREGGRKDTVIAARTHVKSNEPAMVL